jgi:hypothetical protein
MRLIILILLEGRDAKPPERSGRHGLASERNVVVLLPAAPWNKDIEGRYLDKTQKIFA